MHHLCQVPDLTGRPRFRFLLPACQAQVRFFALHRIEPHAPPLVRAPVNSFEFQPCGRTPQAERLNALAAARKGLNPPTPSAHRLQRGLPGYLIPFAPHAFAPQRQELPRDPPSPPVFLPISTHFTATPGIPVSSAILKRRQYRSHVPRLSRGISRPTYHPAYAPFTPSNSEQRLPPLSYRGCWHRVGRGFLCRYRQMPAVFTPTPIFPTDSGLRPEGLRPPRGVTPSGFRPLRKIPHCCLP